MLNYPFLMTEQGQPEEQPESPITTTVRIGERTTQGAKPPEIKNFHTCDITSLPGGLTPAATIGLFRRLPLQQYLHHPDYKVHGHGEATDLELPTSLKPEHFGLDYLGEASLYLPKVLLSHLKEDEKVTPSSTQYVVIGRGDDADLRTVWEKDGIDMQISRFHGAVSLDEHLRVVCSDFSGNGSTLDHTWFKNETRAWPANSDLEIGCYVIASRKDNMRQIVLRCEVTPYGAANGVHVKFRD